MAAFCIPKPLAAKLKQAAINGEIDIASMYEMDSRQRRELFTKWVDKDTAREINTGFEKAMISSQQDALKKWAQATFTGGEQRKAKYKDVVAKIDNLREAGLLTPENSDAFLEDLVASKLGATITSEEAGVIVKKAEKLQALSEGRDEYGLPTIEYFKAKREMDDYIDSLTPQSQLRVATETIGRATMLLSVKSPLLNIESNTIKALTDALERRLTNKSAGGVNGSYAKGYMARAIRIFKETGYDVTRMMSLDSERRTLGEDRPNVQGSGAVRKVGRIYTDIVFKTLLSLPDVVFSAGHFADSANIASTKIAQRKGLQGEEMRSFARMIFEDATRIDPQTEDGKIVRDLAIADAQYGTYTNDSVTSDLALGIRKLFNAASGDVRLGDQLMPFVKTPANVVQTGLDASGVLLPFDTALRMVDVVKAVRSGDELSEALGESFKGFSRKVVRAGLGMTFAFALSQLFEPDEFIGEYPLTEKERELLRLKNATTNSVRIGDRWVSLDYFGPLGAPLVGMLYAKKYGSDLPQTALRYYQGVGQQALKVPGFNEFYDTIEAIRKQRPDSSKSAEQLTSGITNFAADFIRARIVPGIVYDLAKATDTSERQVDYDDPASATKAGIPGLRDDLPEAYNILGETRRTEGWATILFGSRVKTANNDPVVEELVRLDNAGNLPSITDVSKTSPRAKELKEQIGQERFDQAMREFGTNFKDELNFLMEDPYYLESADDEKKKLIEDIKSELFEYTLYQYDYIPPEEE